jgi:hypothetical protein
LKTKYKTYIDKEEAEKRANYLRGRGYWAEIKRTTKGKYRLSWNKESPVYEEKGKRANLISRASSATGKELGRETRGIGKSYGRHFARKESDFDITKGQHPIIGMVYDDEHMPRIAQLPKAP